LKKILLLGGYGTFGRRIALRAAEAGFEVLVAGRSGKKAEAFCAGRPGLVPLALDRGGGLPEALAHYCPFALVDAAGPFQGAGYEAARAAVAAGCHYLDIADASDFVCGIAALDGAARQAGVAVISGASSLPALSGAVVRRLADDIDDVRAVEIALSATSRGMTGRSVTLAILSYLGKPIRLRRGARWTAGHGWQELRRQDFAIAGVPRLRRRLTGLAEVPDLTLLPGRLPGRPAVTFRAGTDMRLHVLGLWLLSWPVRWRWVGGVAPFAGLLSALQRWTGKLGSRRSAMIVRLFGLAGAGRVEWRWTLIADAGDGPHIPSLAVPILLDQLAAGRVEAGARDAGTLLGLEDFQPGLARLAVAQEIVELALPPPLYARVMGPRFAALPPAVRAMHDILRDGGASGRARVTRGRNGAARLVAGLFRFPREGAHDLRVAFTERDGREGWVRDFSGRRFGTMLAERGGLLTERFGALGFGFALPSDGAGLRMVLRRWWLGPFPLPLALAPRTEAREWEEGGRFHFDVAIALPLIGPLVHYRGWLVKEQNGVKIAGGCHCRAVRFEAEVPREVELLDCNCSICTMTGFRHLIVPHGDFRLLSGAERLASYRFGTGAADHLFCSVCGVKSYYQPRSHPDAWSVNLNALDDVSALRITARPFDGRNWDEARRGLD